MTKRHHHTPVYYLKGFVDTESKITVIRIDTLKKHRSNPINVGVEKGFYSYETPSGEIEQEKLEKYFAEEIENPSNLVLRKLRKGKNITIKEKTTFSKYIYSLFRRGRAAKVRQLEILPEVIDRTLIELEELSRIASDLNPSGKMRIEQNRNDATKYLHEVKEVGSSYFLKPDWQGFESSILKETLSRKWIYLVCPKNSRFITSDNPVFIHKKVGFLNSDLTFPLSSNLCLCCTKYFGDADQTWLPISKGNVTAINRRTALNCAREIYLEKDNLFIQRLIKKKLFKIRPYLSNGQWQEIARSDWLEA